jgi:hypothetical protein
MLSARSVRLLAGFLIGGCTLAPAALAEPATRPEPRPAKPGAPDPAANTGLIDLRPKWSVGQPIRYTMKQVSTSQMPDISDPKKTTKVTNTQEIGFDLVPKAVDAETGQATVDMVYRTVRIKLEGAGVDLDFDSTKPDPSKKPGQDMDPSAMLSGFMRGMVGTTLTLTFDKSGTITSVSGGQSLDPTGLLSGLGGAAGAGGAGASPGGSLFGPISTSGATGGLVKLGQKWTHINNLAVGPLGEMAMKTDHEMRSHRANRAEVEFKGRIDQASAGKEAIAQVKAATQSGKYVWDTAKGQLVSMTMEQRVVQNQPGVQKAAEATSTTTMTVTRADR